MRLAILLLCIAWTASCALKRQTGVKVFIGLECHATATMHGCDVSTSPPVCKTVELVYDKNCEKIELK